MINKHTKKINFTKYQKIIDYSKTKFYIYQIRVDFLKTPKIGWDKRKCMLSNIAGEKANWHNLFRDDPKLLTVVILFNQTILLLRIDLKEIVTDVLII